MLVTTAGSKPGPRIGDLDAREVVGDAGEEHDALAVAQRGVADGVADDLGGQQIDRVGDVAGEALRVQRAPHDPRRLRAGLEGEDHLAALCGVGHPAVGALSAPNPHLLGPLRSAARTAGAVRILQ